MKECELKMNADQIDAEDFKESRHIQKRKISGENQQNNTKVVLNAIKL
jgi:hypothetical protein